MKLHWKHRLRIRKVRTMMRNYQWWPSLQKVNPGITIIYANKTRHGGLMDRVKGMVSASFIAELAGLPLAIFEENESSGILNYIRLKNEKQWLRKPKNIFNAWTYSPVLLNDQAKFPKDELLGLFRKKRAYHLYCNLDFSALFFGKEQAQQKWRERFHQMFYFDEKIVKQADQLLNGVETCGIHLRFTTILGDFKDSTSTVLAVPERDALMEQCAQAVFGIIQTQPFKQYMVVSDSVLFLEHIKKNSHLAGDKKLIWPEGNIGHVDYKHDADIMEKTVLDFYLLSRCSKIYQVKEQRMYNSQYSLYASIVSGAPYELFKI